MFSYSELTGWSLRFQTPQLDWDVTHVALSNRRGELGPKLLACASDQHVRLWTGDASRSQLTEVTRQVQADLSRLNLVGAASASPTTPAPAATPPSPGTSATQPSACHGAHR